jgi:hypothetical protein
VNFGELKVTKMGCRTIFQKRARAGFLVGLCRTSWVSPRGFLGVEGGIKKNRKGRTSVGTCMHGPMWPCSLDSQKPSSLFTHARKRSEEERGRSRGLLASGGGRRQHRAWQWRVEVVRRASRAPPSAAASPRRVFLRRRPRTDGDGDAHW